MPEGDPVVEFPLSRFVCKAVKYLYEPRLDHGNSSVLDHPPLSVLFPKRDDTTGFEFQTGKCIHAAYPLIRLRDAEVT